MSSTPRPLVGIDELRARLRAEMPRLRNQYAVKRLALHGSRLRGEASSGSDLDVLVDFANTEAGRSVSLLDFIALQNELEELLGLPVDLGEAAALGDGPAAQAIRREATYVE